MGVFVIFLFIVSSLCWVNLEDGLKLAFFWDAKRSDFFLSNHFYWTLPNLYYPQPSAHKSAKKNITFEGQAKQEKFPFLHTPYSCTQKCQKTTTFERYTKNESIDCYVSLPHFSFNPLQDSTSCRDSKGCTHTRTALICLQLPEMKRRTDF